MKIALIDHDDSFTFNLRQWLTPLSNQIIVYNHLDLIEKKIPASDLFVLSPGPKNPKDYPHTLDWLSSLAEGQCVFGVCLGMQMMFVAENEEVQPYSPPLHGKKSRLVALSEEIKEFENFAVARYHSLICKRKENSVFDLLAESDEDQKPMWVRHKEKNWLGFQFHPESFLTENSNNLLNYLNQWVQK